MTLSLPYMALLVILLAALAYRTYANQGAMARFRLLTGSAERQRCYLRMTLRSFVQFGLIGMAILAIVGKAGAVRAFPHEFEPLRLLLGQSSGADGSDTGSIAYYGGMIGGVACGGSVSYVIWRFLLRRKTQPVIGDVEALFPRNRAEVLATLPLAINAGLSEEVFFRLALPMVATLATGSAMAGFIIAGLSFGLAHWYQGWKSVLLITGISGFFSYVYLSTGSLMTSIVLHAAVDVIALTVRPAISLWLDGRAARRAAPQAGHNLDSAVSKA
ncbi:CPBP family intramembrane glutamic endopeptidase [Novosphingobium beihaiensis]|uniref:CPBP family intramembrane metalloprotease n=1 Tax=Novosphingobium beihaiensis TaxID=2930389 RepID=A0ABT0BNZ8_9SPHN|nr:CPBP family intramembrane glutamic endopeptidase [Novosphingobium beihaiensis]MCJ2186588.1 CPBP family intramembrane metalloprotease [Novosphingobium beihaiensis]